MTESLLLLHDLGAWSVSALWLPVATWSAVCTIAYFWIRRMPDTETNLRSNVVFALLFALPATLLISFLAPVPESWSLLPEIPAAVLVEATSALATKPVTGMAVPFSLMTLFGALTLVVVAIGIARLAAFASNIAMLQRFHRSGNMTSDVAAEAGVRRIASLLSVARPIRVYRSDEVSHAYSAGVIRPVILLPSAPVDELVLWHETLHHARGDIALTWLLEFIVAAFGMHPLVRYLRDQAVLDMEIACDRDVLQHTSSSVRGYAGLLLDSTRQVQARYRVAVGMNSTISQLKHRIDAMNNPAEPRFGGRATRLVGLSLFVGLSVLAACTTGGTGDAATLVTSPESDRAETSVAPAPSMAKIAGTITNADGTPVVGAVITAAGVDDSAVTNEEGRFWMLLPSGERDVTVTVAGVSKTTRVELSASYTRELNLEL